MMQYNIDQAQKISDAVESNISDLIVKLCENEPREVQPMVWTMVTARMAMLSGHGDCFLLPPMDEL